MTYFELGLEEGSFLDDLSEQEQAVGGSSYRGSCDCPRRRVAHMESPKIGGGEDSFAERVSYYERARARVLLVLLASQGS